MYLLFFMNFGKIFKLFLKIPIYLFIKKIEKVHK